MSDNRLPDEDLTVLVERAAKGVHESRQATPWEEVSRIEQNVRREQYLPVIFHGTKALYDLGYRKPRTITTHTEVVRLPRGSVLYDNSEITWLLMPDGEGGQFWLMAGDTEEYTGMDIELPATVLREPSA